MSHHAGAYAESSTSNRCVDARNWANMNNQLQVLSKHLDYVTHETQSIMKAVADLENRPIRPFYEPKKTKEDFEDVEDNFNRTPRPSKRSSVTVRTRAPLKRSSVTRQNFDSLIFCNFFLKILRFFSINRKPLQRIQNRPFVSKAEVIQELTGLIREKVVDTLMDQNVIGFDNNNELIVDLSRLSAVSSHYPQIKVPEIRVDHRNAQDYTIYEDPRNNSGWQQTSQR
jgi:hypothetical protein